MFEGTAVQTTDSQATVRCVACGAGVDGPDPAAVARGLGWVDLPGVRICPECSSKPEVWAAVAVQVTAVGDEQFCLWFRDIPLMLGGLDQVISDGVNMRASLAGLLSSAMVAARRG